MGWSRLPPSGGFWIIPVCFGDNIIFLIRTSCFETTCASDCHHAWSRQVVLVNSSQTGISPEDICSKVKNRSALRRGRCSFFETESEKNGFCRYNSRQLEFRHEIIYAPPPPKIGDELTCYTKEQKKWEVYRGWLWNHAETSWAQKSSQVSCFLYVGKRLLAFEMFPEFQRSDSKSYKLGGWGNAETKGK